MPEVSWSELDALRQCQYKHQLAWLERWRPTRESPALLRGRIMHQVLSCHYGTQRRIPLRQLWLSGEPVGRVSAGADGGPGDDLGLALLDPQLAQAEADPDEAMLTVPGLLEEYTSLLGSLNELRAVDHDRSEEKLLEWMYRGYVEQWGGDSDWEVVGVEVPFSLWLPTEKGTRSTFRLKGRIDLLVRWKGGLWIVDHKTGRELPKERDLDLDDQMGLYTYLLRRTGLDIRGVIYNAIRTNQLQRAMTMDERFSRTITVRGEHELETMAVEALRQFRAGHRPRHGVDAPRTPNPDTCRWRCPFTEPCLAGRKGADPRRMLEDMGFIIDLTRH
jgi:hypothetical protein